MGKNQSVRQQREADKEGKKDGRGLSPCAAHESGKHYVIFMPVPGDFCMDCGEIFK